MGSVIPFLTRISGLDYATDHGEATLDAMRAPGRQPLVGVLRRRAMSGYPHLHIIQAAAVA